MISILCVGDVVGKPGRTIVSRYLPTLQAEFDVDFTVLNIENSASGFGFTRAIYDEFLALNVQAMTSGNHVFAKREVMREFDTFDRLVRPINFSNELPGIGCRYFYVNHTKIAVINCIGRVFMAMHDCPFKAMDTALKDIEAEIILVDFHAEATSEKQAMGMYLKNRATLIYGTHTHVQTADARQLSEKTGFITDIGMCGAYDSVIGMDSTVSISKLIDQLPTRHLPVKTPSQFVIGGICIQFDTITNMIHAVTPIHRVYANEDN